MRHKCKYFLVDEEGVRRCVDCGKPAHPMIEDKMLEKHEDKIYPSESKRLRGGKHGIKTKHSANS